MVFFLVMFSYEGIELWIGEKFAINSSLILQLLSIGILMNSISMIPNNFFQGIGKPKIPSLINLAELPVYVFIMWFSIQSYGIKGAAAAYLVMATIDAVSMYIVANKLYKIKFVSAANTVSFLIMLIVLIIPFFMSGLILKLIFTISYFSVYLIFAWKYFLSFEERAFISSKFKTIRLFHA